jgi:hypothetical protein
VTEGRTILVFTGRGDLLELDPDGTERLRTAVGVGPVGPGAILADGTVVAMTTAGDAVGIARGAVRFRTRVGDPGALVKIAPLALDDGGVVVANNSGPGGAPVASEIAALDVDGRVRTRATVPVPIAWPLVATKVGVACITAGGVVFLWTPGHAPRVAGSFGGALDGGAAALDGHTLVAVVDARRLVALDLDHADARVLATSAAGALLGPPSLRADAAYVMEVSPGLLRLVAVDPSGKLSSRSLSVGPAWVDTVGASTPAVGGNNPPGSGGVAQARPPVHSATLVDGSGRVAFAGPDGHVGVVFGDGLTELGEVVCGRGAPPLGGPPTVLPNQRAVGPRAGARPSAGFAGLVPTGPNAFLVACEAGMLMQIQGALPAQPPNP